MANLPVPHSARDIAARILAALRAARLSPEQRLASEGLAALDHFDAGGLRGSRRLLALTRAERVSRTNGTYLTAGLHFLPFLRGAFRQPKRWSSRNPATAAITGRQRCWILAFARMTSLGKSRSWQGHFFEPEGHGVLFKQDVNQKVCND
jgi:hypothetical protein